MAFAEIIESAGGIMEKTRRSLVQIQEMNSTKINYMIITQDNDIHLLTDCTRANIREYFIFPFVFFLFLTKKIIPMILFSFSFLI